MFPRGFAADFLDSSVLKEKSLNILRPVWPGLIVKVPPKGC
jgi:hypothetical protein